MAITRRIITAAGGKQVQANWNESDPNSPAYIQNKPDISGALTRQVVTELPTEDIDPNCIYMIAKSDPETGDYYEEWMYIGGQWELIGSTQTAQVQSDWNESDPTSPAYIANKPATLDFVVPFTEVSDVVSTTVAKADIIAAINAGKDVRATLNDVYFELVAYSESPEKISFSAVLDDTTVSIVGKVVNNNWVWESYDTELNVQADWAEADQNSPAYIDNKPTIPTVNDATITIQQNGTAVGTFTTNDANDTTINLAGTNEWFGTQEEFDALQTYDANTNYHIEEELATVAFTGSYNDLDDKPTIPTVNDATITIQQNGTTVGTFTTNDNTNQTINLAGSNDWFGTQEEFDALQSYDEDTNYHIKQDLATVAFTGSYNDLDDKPSIPAAQVNADWNASSGVAEILNKPTIPTVPSNLVTGVNVSGVDTALTLRVITQSDYDALVQGGTVDANTVYMIN